MTTDFLEQLRDQVRHDIMACIGCNDCLLACPLPESRNVTIAELNMAVTAEQITAPNVMEFVTRCTQCQQCVPVCPADLRRADIVLWNKLKVETVAPNRPVPLQAGEQIVYSNWTVDQLAQHLVSLPLFNGVDPVSMRRILLSATLRRMAGGEVLVHEGGYHERLVVVLDGALEQTAADAWGNRTRILVYGPGSFHGHMSVMSNAHEPYTISAVQDSTVVEFTKAAVVRLMAESGAFKNTLETLYREQSLWRQARSTPLLAALPESSVEWLLQQSHFQPLRPGEVLYREGDHATALYLVKDGFLRVARKVGTAERVLQYFHEGDVCGASAVFFGQRHTATVSANTRSEVIAIPAEAVTRLLDRNPHMRSALEQQAIAAEQALSSIADPRHARPDPKAHNTAHLISLEGLLDEGVVQGTEVLVINTAICTNCNNCVESCERRHGYSRLARSGLQMGDLLFPTACRHCEDPVCLMCSVNGIVREPDGEIRIVPDNCIGCGACAERCPYGNINMHPREKRKEQKGVRRLLGIFTGSGDDQGLDVHHPEKGNQIAVKCDLCAGYGDYACVTGCPVGAAMRINPVEVFGRTDLIVGLEQERVS